MALPLRLQLLFGVLLLLVLAPVQGAFAHAQLLSTSPRDSAVVDTAPTAVTLDFNEPVSPLAMRLIGPDGVALDLGDQASGGATTIVPLPSDLAIGTHILSWRVVSADGHPIAGSLVFSIGAVSGNAGVGTSGDGSVSLAIWISKATLFIAMFIGIGGAAFGALAPLPQASRTLSSALSLAGLFLAPLTLGLQGLDALGLPLEAIAATETWVAGLSTSYGATAILATLAFAWSLGSLRMPQDPIASALGCAAAGLAALALALSGHASAASPQWITRPAVFLHIAGVMVWVGALIPLAFLLRTPTETASQALARFSRGIPFAVAALVVSGVTLAVIQLGTPGPQWLTAYGFILATKILLLALLFALALVNRLWLTGPALVGDALAQKRLRHAIGWELVLVALILALVAGWRFTPPPRALAAIPPPVAAAPITTHLIEGSTIAMLTIEPGGTGPVEVEIVVSDLEHMPKPALSVGLILSNTALGIEPIRRDAVERNGIWQVKDLVIPAPGTWHLEAEIRLSRFDLSRPGGDIVLP